MVIVDRLTKYAIFILFNEDWSADKLKYIFLNRLIRDYRFPEKIISDRNKLFRSIYWKTLFAQTKIKQKMFTVYHLEINGQIKKTNRIFKVYLRCYINDRQNNWVKLLSMA
jgi:hypothetical protein